MNRTAAEHTDPPVIVVNKAGGLYIVITILLGLAAVNTGNNLLFLIVSAMLGFMAMSGVFGLRNLQRLDALLLLPDEIYRNVPARAQLQISTGSRFLPHFLLSCHILNSVALIPFLDKKAIRRVNITLTFSTRGGGSIDTIAVTSPFPVNFFIRSTLIDCHTPYLVFPTPLTPAECTGQGTDEHRGNNSRNRLRGDDELEAFSLYTGSEPLKLVHWKLSARHDELFVRTMQSETGTPVIINPDGFPGTHEEQLGQAVFMINSLMTAGRAVGLQLGNELLPPAVSRNHRLEMLAKLARHDQA